MVGPGGRPRAPLVRTRRRRTAMAQTAAAPRLSAHAGQSRAPPRLHSGQRCRAELRQGVAGWITATTAYRATAGSTGLLLAEQQSSSWNTCLPCSHRLADGLPAPAVTSHICTRPSASCVSTCRRSVSTAACWMGGMPGVAARGCSCCAEGRVPAAQQEGGCGGASNHASRMGW